MKILADADLAALCEPDPGPRGVMVRVLLEKADAERWVPHTLGMALYPDYGTRHAAELVASTPAADDFTMVSRTAPAAELSVDLYSPSEPDSDGAPAVVTHTPEPEPVPAPPAVRAKVVVIEAPPASGGREETPFQRERREARQRWLNGR